MLEIPTWLERLNRATDYRELQEVFSGIVAQAQADGEHGELAHSIDEAVRRLEAERARDEGELRDVQARYESFRQENSGVVGWFKRHIPFTETRRHEHEHRESVAQQAAEILADNLVIARAQMVKERFLSASDRKLGHRADDWRVRLDRAASDRQLASLAQVLKDLAIEGEQGHAFLEAVKHDIDSFADAEFKAAEDRQRRDADLAAAQNELAELAKEVGAKAGMKRAGLKELTARAAAELDAADPTFQADGRQLVKLNDTLTGVTDARASLKQLAEATAPLGNLAKELKALPNEMQQARDRLRQLESQRSDAAAAFAKKNSALDERRGQFETAQRDVDQARQLLASAQQFYEAYQAECRANQTMPVTTEAGATVDSPMLRKFNEAKAAADTAEARLREVTPVYESAKKEVAASQASQQELDKQLEALRDKLHGLEHRSPQLRLEMGTAIDRTQVAFAAAAAALGALLASERRPKAAFQPQTMAAGMFNTLGPGGLERGLADALVQAERDYQRHLQAVQVLDRLSKWLDTQRQSVEHERTAAHDRRQKAWNRRCSELLGDHLAKEACAAGLPS